MVLKKLGQATTVFTLMAALCTGALAAPADAPVVMESPAKDAAMVVKLQGLANNVKIKMLDGSRQTLNDGIVIRKSYIQDGKIVIPAGGLFTTSRCGNWFSFNDHLLSIAGKMYHFITDEYQQDVVKNVTLKPKQKIFGNVEKNRGWELVSIEPQTYGFKGSYRVTIKLVKTTGNYYGSAFQIIGGPNVTPFATNGSLKNGSGMKEGTTPGMEQKNVQDFIVGNDIATNARSAVYVDAVSDNEVKVKELNTVSTTKVLISPNEPVMGSYAKGDSFKVGTATVDVTDVTGDSVTLKITDPKGSATHTLKVDAAMLKEFPASRVACKQLYALSPSGKETVNINVHNEGGAFAGGKVALMGYSDVITITNGSTWGVDDRFIVRPETCASCTFPHEIVVENAKPIVLDAKNNSFNGPGGYFKIVVDKFDGTTIGGWHVETAKGTTDNLAARAQGKHVDLVIGADCRSTAHFFSRVYPALYREALGVK